MVRAVLQTLAFLPLVACAALGAQHIDLVDDTISRYSYAWEELRDDAEPILTPTPNTHTRRRPWISFGRQGPGTHFGCKKEETMRKTCQRVHPLRTNEFFLDIHWRHAEDRAAKPSAIHLDFAENGLVRATTNTTSGILTKEYHIGTWSSKKLGSLTFSLPFETTGLNFFCEIHLNPYGNQPKALRGIIIEQCRARWFRRVRGTFSGDGVGRDTAVGGRLLTAEENAVQSVFVGR